MELNKRHVELLLQLVDSEIARIRNEANSQNVVNGPQVPHIEACCANCGYLRDLKFELSCPACQEPTVRYARLVPEQEAKERYANAVQSQLRTAMDRIMEWQTAALGNDEELSVAECEAIFRLDSSGSKP
jgi:hypothetical protein